MKKQIKILAVSGSLRAGSSNDAVLKTVQQLMPPMVTWMRYEGIAQMPHFDDRPDVPETVLDWRRQIRSADAILICSPEYAFGVPGALKNALDWTVGTGDFDGKPLALITAASQGAKAHEALLHIFQALSASIPEKGVLLIPFIRSKLNNKGEVKDAATLQDLQQVVEVLLNHLPA